MNIYQNLKNYKQSIRLISQQLRNNFGVQDKFQQYHPLFMDMQSTTPIDFRVLDAMMPYQTSLYGNPHSKSHEFGWEGEIAVEKARKQIADLIGADPREIIFTSGATESNNAALKGLSQFYGKTKNHIITTQIEHKCVLDTCRHLEDQGFKVTYLPVSTNGLIDLDELKSSITPQTLCCSVMHTNNEVGVMQDIRQIGQICRENKVFFHSDCAQAVGKHHINVNDLNLDLISISSHKLYGPKGIGALYVRRKPKVRIIPIINGGGQERGLRSGTLSPALCVGFGQACEIAQQEMENDLTHSKKLFEKLHKELSEQIPMLLVNGDLKQRSPYNFNASFTFVEGESLLMAVKQLAVSSGSACTSSSLEPSYVLRAMGVPVENAHTSIRIGIGRFTTEQEIDFLIQNLVKSVTRLRELSPLYEMHLEGIDISKIEWSQPH